MNNDMKSRVAMVAFSSYPSEPRTRRETEALIEAGYSVDVISPKRPGEAFFESVNGVNIYRLPVVKTRNSKLSYLWEYAWFGLLAFFMLTWLYLRRRYDVVHVHNIPEILVFTALIPKLFGSKVLLDMHDPMPELFVTKYKVQEDHSAIALLKVLERLCMGFADQVLVPNKACHKLFANRGCDPRKMQVLLNSPDERIFKLGRPSSRPFKLDSLTLICHGTITERSGLSTALQTMVLLKNKIPNLSFHVYGDGDFVGEFLRLRTDFGLADIVQYHGHATLETIASALDISDVGVIPNNRNPFTDIATPTRVFECLRKGIPAIASRLPGVLDYFSEDSLFLFEPDDAADLAKVIELVYANPTLRLSVLEQGMAACGAYWWETEKQILLRLYEGLLPPPHSEFSADH
ncbi:glycosyltransferase family 4 protein [Methylomagnum sp.]